jgi:hypothetical protein
MRYAGQRTGDSKSMPHFENRFRIDHRMPDGANNAQITDYLGVKYRPDPIAGARSSVMISMVELTP